MEDLILDNILDAAFIVDNNEKVLYCNEAASTVVGISLRRVLKAESLSKLITFKSEQPLTLPGPDQKMEEMQSYIDVEYKTSKGKEGQALFFIRPHDENWLVLMHEMTVEADLHYGYKEQLEAKEVVIEELKEAQVKLKEYSENLEVLVAERTEELRESNTFLSTMIDSLGQGLMVFNGKGDCHQTYTKICEEIYENSPGEKKVWDLLPDRELVESWVGQIFADIIPIEDVLDLGPDHFRNNNGREIDLEYLPMKMSSDSVDSVVVVATDKTEEYKAKKLAISKEKYAERILKVSGNKEQFFGFVNDCRIILDEISNGKLDLDQTYRDVHSLKGGAAMFSLEELEQAAHATESILSDFRTGQEEDKNLFKKSFEDLQASFYKTVDEFKQIVGDALDYHQRKVEIPFFKLQNYSKKLALELGEDAKLTQELIREFIYRPVKSFLIGYEEMIQNLSRQYGKNIYAIEWINAEVSVCPTRYNNLFKSMVHLFRNAVAHGLEMPEDRIALGKDKSGSIRVEFKEIDRKGCKFFRIIVSDDGKGINPNLIAKKLKSQNREKEIENKSNHQIIQHVFDMDLSTSVEVDQLSGRGVGLSAVKVEVEKLSGTINAYSEIELGTQFEIEFPL